MEKRYLSMNSELERTLAQVEKLIQFNLSLAIHTKLSSSQALNIPPKKPTAVLLPQTRTLRFFNRIDIFAQLDSAFEDNLGRTFKSVALWGLGGIGKSTIALRYLETMVCKGKYDAMFWIHSEKHASMRLSFTAIAMKLKLPGAKPHPQFHDDNLDLVQRWLQSTGTPQYYLKHIRMY